MTTEWEKHEVIWYQTWNSFGDIIFAQQWSEAKAHPTLRVCTFYCPIPAPAEFGHWIMPDKHGHWVTY